MVIISFEKFCVIFISHSAYGNTYGLNILEQANKESSHELLIIVWRCRKVGEHQNYFTYT